MKSRLGWLLPAALALLVAASLLAGLALRFAQERQALQAAQIESAQALGAQLAAALAGVVADTPALTRTVEQAALAPRVRQALLWRADGTLVARALATPSRDAPVPAFAPPAARVPTVRPFEAAASGSRPPAVRADRASIWHPVLGAEFNGWLQVVVDRQWIADLERENAIEAAVIAATAALLAWLCMLVIARRNRHALREVSRFASALDGSGRRLQSKARTPEMRGLVAALNEASARLAAQQRAAEVNAGELRALTGNIPGVVYRCRQDEHWTMEHLSQEFERLTGYPASELIGNRVRSYASIIHPADTPKVRALIEAAVKQRRPFAAEYRLRAADGSTRWVLEKGQGVFADGGELLGLTGVIINDTARHSAVAALARSELQHRQLVENLSEAVWQADPEARISFVNQAWERMSGTPTATLVGSRLFAYIVDADQPAAISAWSRLLAGREPVVQWQARFITASGDTRWGEFTARLTVDAQGKPSGVAGLLSDIHERKLLDERLRAGEERLRESLELSRQLLEAMPNPVYYKDRHGRLRGVNRAWERFHGRPRSEVVGLTSAELGPPELAELIDARDRQLLSGHEDRQEFEVSLANAEGVRREMLFSTAVLTSYANERTGLLGVLTDITERKLREEALRASEATARRLAQVVDQASEAIMVKDLDGRLIAWNRGAQTLFGYASDEVLGLPADEVLQVAQPAADERGAGPRAEGLSVARRVRKDGSLVDVELSVSPLYDPSGRHVGEIGVARDISDRLRYQAELEAAKDSAEAANKAKGAFLANISHEIRTPMNGIIGMTELALDTDLDAEQRDYLGSVRRSAEHLLQVINDLLDYSKIEAGRIDLESIPFSLRAALSDPVKSLGARARERSLEMVLDIAPDVPDAVIGDPLRLGQVLLNLISNAIKFTEHGEIVVSVERVDTPAAGDSDGAQHAAAVLRFSVTDTGIGIDLAKQIEIFDPFIQADTSTTRRYGGTGLGLSISRQLVALMGGGLAVHSEQGEGSTFWFDLTLALDGAAVDAAPPGRLAAGRRAGVLLIDDSISSRRGLVHLFERWGTPVVECESLDEARHLAADAGALQAQFDLVLVHAARVPSAGEPDPLDVLARWLDRALPLVIVAGPGAARPSDPVWRSIGATAVLPQPVTGSDLYNAIGTLLPAPAAADAATPAAAAATPDDLRAGRDARHAQGLDVLLAEDNPVNQKLALTLLERAGHRVQVADDGLAAVEAWRAHHFDVVLMDVQMPLLGGFEATARIRVSMAFQFSPPGKLQISPPGCESLPSRVRTRPALSFSLRR